MNNNENINNADLFQRVRDAVANSRARSTYARAVRMDALDLLESDGVADAVRGCVVLLHTAAAIAEINYSESVATRQHAREMLRDALLCGANNWQHYSWGGCALIFDEDIAKHYCTPSELKRCNNGAWNIRRGVEWLTVQGNALRSAESLIRRAVVDVAKGNA